MKKKGLQGYLNMKVEKWNWMKREVNEEGWQEYEKMRKKISRFNCHHYLKTLIHNINRLF